jgi:hypothetical protein
MHGVRCHIVVGQECKALVFETADTESVRLGTVETKTKIALVDSPPIPHHYYL